MCFVYLLSEFTTKTSNSLRIFTETYSMNNYSTCSFLMFLMECRDKILTIVMRDLVKFDAIYLSRLSTSDDLLYCIVEDDVDQKL